MTPIQSISYLIHPITQTQSIVTVYFIESYFGSVELSQAWVFPHNVGIV